MRLLPAILMVAVFFTKPCFADPAFPWKAGDAPPAVAGLHLGDSEEKVRTTLGKPDSVGQMGAGTVFTYVSRGLQVISTQADGVSIIRLQKPEAGMIDGIHVGDGLSDVLAKWGHPYDGHDRTALFSAGVWTVEVRLDDKLPEVVDLMLAWNTKKFGPDFDTSNERAFRPQ